VRCVCGVCSVCVACVCGVCFVCACAVCCVCVHVCVHICPSLWFRNHEHSRNEKFQTVSLGEACLNNVKTISTKTHPVVFMKFQPIHSNSHRDGSGGFCEDKNVINAAFC
jgi:hypothetical protein